MIKTDKGYRITNIQQSDENHDFDCGFDDAYATVTGGWPIHGQLQFKYFSTWMLSSDCPSNYIGTLQQKLWEGEKDFYETQMDNLGKLIEEGKHFLSTIDNPILIDKAKQLGQESFGVAYYIYQLFKRKYPSDRTDWLIEY